MNKYPLVENLEKINDDFSLDLESKIEKTKAVLLEDVNQYDDKKIKDARFDVAYAVFGPKPNRMTYALARLEAQHQLEHLLATYESFDPDLTMSADLLIIYLENHKYYLGNDFFEVLYEVFGGKSDYVVDVMYDQIQENITSLMGKYYPYTTAENNKRSFAEYFQEKFKGTYFEIMVIQFTNDYLKNGKCVPA